MICLPENRSHREADSLWRKKTQGVYRAKSGAFDRLMIAGERLIAVIKKCQGMANKDLGKFADQINSLCDKWGTGKFEGKRDLRPAFSMSGTTG